jgi:hypothetical protein
MGSAKSRSRGILDEARVQNASDGDGQIPLLWESEQSAREIISQFVEKIRAVALLNRELSLVLSRIEKYLAVCEELGVGSDVIDELRRLLAHVLSALEKDEIERAKLEQLLFGCVSLMDEVRRRSRRW